MRAQAISGPGRGSDSGTEDAEKVLRNLVASDAQAIYVLPFEAGLTMIH